MQAFTHAYDFFLSILLGEGGLNLSAYCKNGWSISIIAGWPAFYLSAWAVVMHRSATASWTEGSGTLTSFLGRDNGCIVVKESAAFFLDGDTGCRVMFLSFPFWIYYESWGLSFSALTCILSLGCRNIDNQVPWMHDPCVVVELNMMI